MVKACCSQKASLVIMIALTTTFFFAEIVVGYGTNSMALVADSFHMLSDVVSLFVGFFALKISQQKHRRTVGKNTFGWVRAEVLGALVNSVFLIALCFSIVVESLKRIVTPEGIDQPVLVLAIGAAGLFINIMGIFIFQGHMGHGHSHGGHGHSHGGHSHNKEGHGHNHGKHGHSKKGHGHSHGENGHSHSGKDLTKEGKYESKVRVSEESTSVAPEVQNIEQRICEMDRDRRRASSRESELTTVVIVNKVVAREEDVDVSVKETNREVQGENIGGLAESRVHMTPSRYKMGIMLAAIQANEDAIEKEANENTDKEEPSSTAKRAKNSDQMNIRGVYLHVLGDALGSVIVICSALAIYYGSGDWTLYVDPGMSILMVAIILKSSIPLLKESSMILLQTVPTHIQIQELTEKLLGQFPSIVGVHEFHVWQLAGSKIVASLHLKLPSRGDYMSISESLKNFFHDEGIHSTTIQPEFIEEVETTNNKLTTSDLCLLQCESILCQESFCCIVDEEKVDNSIDAETPQEPNDIEVVCSSAV